MILSRPDLKEAWKSKKIRFRPDISEEQIGLSSIDLRLGYVFTRLIPRLGHVIRPAAEGFDPTNLVEHENFEGKRILGEPLPFRLKPGELKLALTLEEVAFPGSLAANVQGRSSLARAGVAVHITAPHIHPGFVGRITLELYNHGPWELEFIPGRDLVCQIIFFKVTKSLSSKVIKSLGTYMKQTTPFPSARARPAGRGPSAEAQIREMRDRRFEDIS